MAVKPREILTSAYWNDKISAYCGLRDGHKVVQLWAHQVEYAEQTNGHLLVFMKNGDMYRLEGFFDGDVG